MSEPQREVHEQSNGARIIVASPPPPPPAPPGSVVERLTARSKARPPRRRAPRTTRHARTPLRDPARSIWPKALEGYQHAFIFGTMSLILVAMLYNGFIYMTGLNHRGLAALSGVAIGFAIRAGAPHELDPRAHKLKTRLIAVGFAYLCLATTYVAFFYDQFVYPEYYDPAYVSAAIESAADDYWSDPWGGDSSGFETLFERSRPFSVVGAVVGAAKAAVFPLFVFSAGGAYHAVWLVAAFAAAFKTSAKGW